MKSPTLTLNDIWYIQEKNKKNSPSQNDFPNELDMMDFESGDYETILRHQKAVSLQGNDFTVLDLFHIPLESDEEIRTFLQSRLEIDINSPDGVGKINEIFQKALSFYEERFLKHLPINIKKKTFKSIDDVIKFLRETKENKVTGKINCAIAKVCYAVDGILNHEKIKRTTLLVDNFILTYLKPPFKIQTPKQDEYGNTFLNGEIQLQWKKIKFDFIARQKQVDSIIGKQLADAQYNSIDNFMDLIGGTFYVDEDSDAAILMQYIYDQIYQGDCEIANKNGINPDIAIAGKWLHREFHQAIKHATLNTKESKAEKTYNQRKSSSSPNYKEIKLKWYIKVPMESGAEASKYPVGTELKFVIGWHDNEQGSTLQNIYDYAKRFRELSRLGIPIRELDLINYINDFFENIDDILQKKNKQKDTYFEELYRDLVDKEFLPRTPSQEPQKVDALLSHFSDLGSYFGVNLELTHFITHQLATQWYVDGDEFIKRFTQSQNKILMNIIKQLEWYGAIVFKRDQKPQFTQKDLAIGLYNYYKSMLVAVELPNTKKVYFFDKHILKLIKAWLYHPMQEVA